MGINPKKITLIQNGVDFVENPILERNIKIKDRKEILNNLKDKNIQKDLNTYVEDYWVIYLARLYPQKGQDHAIKLWNEIDENLKKNMVLLFVGPESYKGELSRLIEIRNKANYSNKIIFIGASNEPKKWLMCSDMFISCSESEGMPLGPLEAVSAGIPSLLSDIEGHRFLFPYTFQCNLLNPSDGAFKTETIISLINSQDKTVFIKMLESKQTFTGRVFC